MNAAYLSTTDNDTGKNAGIMVILLGIVTTIISLALIWFLNSIGFYLFGLTVLFVVPAGALLFGAVAGSGYAIGSQFTGVKVGGGLLVLIAALLVGGYGTAQYLDYKAWTGNQQQSFQDAIEQFKAAGKAAALENGEQFDEAAFDEAFKQDMKPKPIGFLEYYDSTTRNMSFGEVVEFEGDQRGAPLGILGYGFRLLEILGFSLGGLIAPLALRASPYCRECQIYKKTHQLGLLPAGVKPRKVKKKDTAGQAQLEKDIQTALDGGLQLVNETAEAATEDNVSAFQDMMGAMKSNKKEIGKMTSRVQVELQYCPDCNQGDLVFKMLTGFNEDQSVEIIRKAPVSQTFSRQVRV